MSFSYSEIRHKLEAEMGVTLPDSLAANDLKRDVFAQSLSDRMEGLSRERFKALSGQDKETLRKECLRIADQHWNQHLAGMDALTDAAQLQTFVGKKAEEAYAEMGFELFENTTIQLRKELTKNFLNDFPIDKQVTF